MTHGYTLFSVDVQCKYIYIYVCVFLRVRFPLRCSLTALWQLRFLTEFVPANPFPAAAVTTILPITKLTTVTVYLLHLICSQNVSPVEPIPMDMTGGGWLVMQSGRGLAKCQFCKSTTCKWDGAVAALLVFETTSRLLLIIYLDGHHNPVVYKTTPPPTPPFLGPALKWCFSNCGRCIIIGL